MSNETSKRKLDHIKTCLEKDVETHYKTTGFEEIELIHQAAPETNLSEIEINQKFFGKTLDAPIIICPMTGGHEKGKEINLTLAEAAQDLNIAFSVGSQRAAIEKTELEETYQVREKAPDILLFGNLGITQLNKEYGFEEAEKAIEMIKADGLGIHFNPLQEAIQPEGHADFKGSLDSLTEITSKLEKPIYVKETGAGINQDTAAKSVKAGAEAIDVSGAGGTTWAGVEAMREKSKTELGVNFWDWGIPTAVSTAEVKEAVDVPIISSGGIRSGLDAAKAFSLGADLVGIALPLFRASIKGKKEVIDWLEEFILELKVSMFLTESENIKELQKASLKISDRLLEWFNSRGLELDKYQR